jgi:hypothetical protein
MYFKQFMDQIDASQIERVYDKARISVELVRMYNPMFLENISTIANLASGAYGLYNSGENKKMLPPDYEQRLIYWGKITKDQIGNIPTKILKQYFPDLEENNIKSSDTIRVNVQRILSQSKTDLEAVLQIASTIVHEATHRIERETKGQTFETGPKGEEHKFMAWASQNIQKILQKYPELST